MEALGRISFQLSSFFKNQKTIGLRTLLLEKYKAFIKYQTIPKETSCLLLLSAMTEQKLYETFLHDRWCWASLLTHTCSASDYCKRPTRARSLLICVGLFGGAGTPQVLFVLIVSALSLHKKPHCEHWVSSSSVLQASIQL